MSRSWAQGRGQCLRAQEEVQGFKHRAAHDGGRGQSGEVRPLGAEDGDAEAGGLEHRDVVGAVAERGAMVGPELLDVAAFVRARVHDPRCGAEVGGDGLRGPERVRRKDMQRQLLTQAVQTLRNARQDPPAIAERPVEIHDQVPQVQVFAAGDVQLRRMSEIADRITPHGLLLCNESFASTNEREGSEIARQVLRAMLDRRIRVVFVTHMYNLAHGFYA
jgi:hypothetical protein